MHPRRAAPPLIASATAGMTLIEILAVVVILSLLAVTLTVGLTGKMGKAKREIAKTQIAQLVSQLQAYQLEKGSLPIAALGLSALTSPAATPGQSYFTEPEKLIDPWGNPYLYLVPGPKGYPYEIISYGSDGQPGGTDDAADISSTSLSQH
jgi:general secretion pathway protein G